MFLLRKKLEKIVIFHHFLHIFRDFRKIEKILQVQIFSHFSPWPPVNVQAIMGRSWGDHGAHRRHGATWSEFKGGTRKMGGFESRNAKTKRPMMTIRRVCMTIGWQSVDNFMTIVMFYNWNVHGNRFFKKEVIII